MALKRNVSRAIGRTVNKWPEFETVAARHPAEEGKTQAGSPRYIG